jgi:mono/diheme cytochrome c family protein
VKKLYRSRCLGCHDQNGSGALVRTAMPEIPDFTRPRWQQRHGSAQLITSILDGKGRGMPAFAGKLNRQEVQALAAHIRTFAPARVKAAPRKPAYPRSVVALFRRRCVRCHGADGKGKPGRETLSEIPDFTRPRWQRSRSTAQLIASIRDGKGAGMPAFTGKVSRQQARDLASYVRSFGPARVKAAAQTREDFEGTFRRLQMELDQLEKELRKLSSERKGAKRRPASIPDPR